MERKVISLTEYAEKKGIDSSALRHRIQRGTFKAWKIGNQWVCYEDETLKDHRKEKKNIQ